ncbi:TerB family tellurite resistance protein [Malikia spinosa]|uniref:TerB family tellurite resistance protein n=1 Tax=Malikia spinosa TaxID=86180 RepID=A0A7C9MX55_9BURK|nr:TerB family tellurite resistance protein [Malikia spinosa]MYZ53476.1 TerB family tellurite resistance protein [Malikia spinosa]OGB71440.1 MAG: Tellurite resistance protein TerB [Burkholderiales bacterium RIFOXYC12_FULL_65_23]
MGLFDMFKSDSGDKMSPHLAFATALLYMMSADGEMDNEEIGHLLSVLGGHDDGRGTIGVGAQSQALLDSALKYRRKNSIETFLQEATPLLTDAQKMCILVNLIDSSLVDGQPEPEEQVLFGKFLSAFGISEERFRPFFEVIVLKNDRQVFTNPNHPKNDSSYRVKLSV